MFRAFLILTQELIDYVWFLGPRSSRPYVYHFSDLPLFSNLNISFFPIFYNRCKPQFTYIKTKNFTAALELYISKFI